MRFALYVLQEIQQNLSILNQKPTEGLLLCKLQMQHHIPLSSLVSGVDVGLLASPPKTQLTSYFLNTQTVIMR